VDILKRLLGWIEKPSPRAGGMVLLTSCAAIWLLRTELLPVPIRTAVRPYEAWIWLAFLLALSLLATYAIEAAWRAAVARRKRKLATKRRISRLRDLTVEERHALQPFFEDHARTGAGHPEDRVVASLVRDGILIPVTQFGVRLSEDTWRYLRAHPSLVATPENPRPPKTGHEWMGR
jgi:hypothetical protein